MFQLDGILVFFILIRNIARKKGEETVKWDPVGIFITSSITSRYLFTIVCMVLHGLRCDMRHNSWCMQVGELYIYIYIYWINHIIIFIIFTVTVHFKHTLSIVNLDITLATAVNWWCADWHTLVATIFTSFCKFVFEALLSVLAHAMAWCWTGDRPLLQPRMTQFTYAYMHHHVLKSEWICDRYDIWF